MRRSHTWHSGSCTGACAFSVREDRKNLAGLRSYPDAVQSIVRERLGDEAPKAKSILPILLRNLVFFTVLFSVIGLVFKNVLAFGGVLPALWYYLIIS